MNEYIEIETNLTYNQLQDRFNQNITSGKVDRIREWSRTSFTGKLSGEEISIGCYIPYMTVTFSNGIIGKVKEENGKCTIRYKIIRPSWYYKIGMALMWGSLIIFFLFYVSCEIRYFINIYPDNDITIAEALFGTYGLWGVTVMWCGFLVGILTKKEGEICRDKLEEIVSTNN